MKNSLIYGISAMAILALICIGCGTEPTEDDTGSSTHPAAVGTWAITDSSGTPGLTYVFNDDNTVTGTAIDASNALLALFGMSALSYTYGPDDIYANGSAAGTYTVVVDTLTITWTNTGNVERCIRQ